MTSRILVCLVLSVLAVSSVSAYVLLSPRRTWDAAPNIVVDNRGQSSITDSDGGATRVASAITANVAWNGAGAGTVIKAAKGSVAAWRLGDGIPMLTFQDPEHACNGNCLAATFTGFYSPRGDGTYRINDADIVTSRRQPFTSTGEPDGCSGRVLHRGHHGARDGARGSASGTPTSAAPRCTPRVSACNNGPATIEADDKAGINDLY